MKYLIFNNEVNIIFGRDYSNINDLKNGKIFKVEKYENCILKEIYSGINIEKLYDSYDRVILDKFVDDLIKNKCGFISNKFYINERKYKGQFFPTVFRTTMNLRKLIVELPTNCNANCEYCNKDLLFGCFSCRNEKSTVKMKDFLEKIYEFLERISVENLIITGGDVLGNFDLFKEFISKIKDKVKNITIYSRIEKINEEKAKYFNENEVDILIHMSEHEYFELKDDLNFLKNLKVKFNVVTIKVKNDRSIVQNSIVSKRKKGNSYKAYVINEPKDLNSIDQYNNVEYLQKFEETIYLEYVHSCLAGSLAIDKKLNILPCLQMAKDVLGNLEDINIERLFSNIKSLNDYWLDPLARNKKCKNCDNRTYCRDCKAIERIYFGESKYCPREASDDKI